MEDDMFNFFQKLGRSSQSMSFVWREFVKMVFVAILLGVIQVALARYLNQFTAINKADESFQNTHALNLFVAWLFMTVTFVSMAVAENDLVLDAIAEDNFQKFKRAATKHIPAPYKIVYFFVALLTVVTYFEFHVANPITLIINNFSIAFFVSITTMIVLDMDDPFEGVFYIAEIPEDWCRQVGFNGTIPKSIS